MIELVSSPNAPRPSGLTLEIADMLMRIEHNYGREGSGPGSRFEGQLLEDVQAKAVLRRVTEHQQLVLVWRDERGTEICRSTPLAPGTTRIGIPLDAFCADLIGGSGE